MVYLTLICTVLVCCFGIFYLIIKYLNDHHTGQYDLLEYIIGSSGSYQCSELLREALYTIDSFIQSGQGEYLRDALNLCHPVDTSSLLDIAALYEHYILFIMDYINSFQ